MKRYLSLALLFTSFLTHAQSIPSPSCAKDEKTFRGLLHDILEASKHGGPAAVSNYYAEGAVISSDDGGIYTRSEYIAAVNKELANNDQTYIGEPDDVSVNFIGEVAILTHVDKIVETSQSLHVPYVGTARLSRIFVCQDGAWKMVFRSEIQRPNATRVPVESERSKFDEYVGNYRTVKDGKLLGDITVSRKGGKLFEAWGKENPEELLPGGHDTFFVRGDGLVEQFVRDERNRVVGIHYIFWDDHFEAKRMK